jgi:hypothetical protein
LALHLERFFPELVVYIIITIVVVIVVVDSERDCHGRLAGSWE